MTNAEKMANSPCPECGGVIELYDTRPDGNGGMYRCLECGRDTSWAVAVCKSVFDLVNELKERVR